MAPNAALSFSRPEALLLLLLLVPLAIYLSRAGLALLRRGRKRLSLGLRIAIITLLVLALSGFEVVRAIDRLSVVFLVDRSDSISASEKAHEGEYLRGALAQMKESDAAGVIAFGADALV